MVALIRLVGVLFFPLVLLYTGLIWLRHKLYDWGWRKSCRIPAPVISIGNIQLGGTGKTPVTEAVARFLLREGHPVGVLSRGYARRDRQLRLVESRDVPHVTPEQIGDEPYLLLQNVPGIMLGVDACRCCTARLIYRKEPRTVFVLDDAFQHRAMQRDLDVVLLDVRRWSRLPFTFPLTDYRDVPASLRRAGAFVLTGASEESESFRKLKKRLDSRYHRPVFSLKLEPVALVQIATNRSFPVEHLKGQPIAAFAGIARPRNFFRSLTQLDARIVFRKRFPDHHYYTKQELEELRTQADAHQVRMVVCTQKDAVKIAPLLTDRDERFYFLQVQARIQPEEEFHRLIREVVSKKGDFPGNV